LTNWREQAIFRGQSFGGKDGRQNIPHKGKAAEGGRQVTQKHSERRT